jgi:hypothetical protein
MGPRKLELANHFPRSTGGGNSRSVAKMPNISMRKPSGILCTEADIEDMPSYLDELSNLEFQISIMTDLPAGTSPRLWLSLIGQRD